MEFFDIISERQFNQEAYSHISCQASKAIVCAWEMLEQPLTCLAI